MRESRLLVKRALLIVTILFLAACSRREGEWVLAQGQHLRFLFYTLERQTFYLNGFRGGKVKLPRQLKDAISAEWSPDGQWVVFSREEMEGVSSFVRTYVTDASGKSQYPLQGTFSANQPTWSPDGRRIVFDFYVTPRFYIGIVDLDCIIRGDVCFDETQAIAEGRSPDWSPDGQFIAYSDYDENQKEHTVYASPVSDPTTVHALSSTELDCMDPRWSPDGEKLVAVCRDRFLYLLDRRNLSYQNLSIQGYNPLWSQDGKRIVFLSYDRDGLGQTLVWEQCASNALFMVELETMEVRRLTQNDDVCFHWFAFLPAPE